MDSPITTVCGFTCRDFTLERKQHCTRVLIEIESYPAISLLTQLMPIFENYKLIELNLLLLLLNEVSKSTKVTFTVTLTTQESHEEFEFTYKPETSVADLACKTYITTSDNIVTFASFDGVRTNILARLYLTISTSKEELSRVCIEYINSSLLEETTRTLARYFIETFNEPYLISFDTEVEDSSREQLTRKLSEISFIREDVVTPTGNRKIYIVDYSSNLSSDNTIAIVHTVDEVITALLNKEDYIQTGLIVHFVSAPEYVKTIIEDFIKKLSLGDTIKAI